MQATTSFNKEEVLSNATPFLSLTYGRSQEKVFPDTFFSFAGALIAEEYARLAPPENACLPPTYPYVNSCLRLLLAQFK
jgi:squalene cyclase